jgi:uncharacterized protein YxjI
MEDTDTHEITNVDLTDTTYTVVQGFIRNKYKLLDSDETVVLRGKQNLFKLKEEFPFVNGDGEDAFRVGAETFVDFAGTYTLFDSVTDEEVVVLDEDFSLFSENWRIREPDSGKILATIESRNKWISVARHLSSIANLIPNKYDIVGPDGTTIGTIEGKFSLRDIYEVSLSTDEAVPTEAVMAAACVIDALENN